MHANMWLAETMDRFEPFEYALVILDGMEVEFTLIRETKDERPSDQRVG
jgi:hypothetical protein